jgi:ribosomal protein S18 acetylase RimI-like enzyme
VDPNLIHRISRATPEDASAMLAIQRRAFAEEGRRSASVELPPLTETLAAIEEHIRHQTALTARDGARVIGAVRGIVADGVCTIRALVVEPEYQGRGIGTALLEALETSHPQVARFDLTTNTVMEGNVPFYERHGYRVTERKRYTDAVTLAHMTKAVAEKG